MKKRDAKIMAKCPHCKRMSHTTNGVFDFHDDRPPCRSVCSNSKKPVSLQKKFGKIQNKN